MTYPSRNNKEAPDKSIPQKLPNKNIIQFPKKVIKSSNELGLQYKFSKNKYFKAQYDLLRKQHLDLTFSNKYYPNVELDESSDLLFVIYHKNTVVAGARLTYCFEGEDALLPMEKNGFLLKEKVQWLQNKSYAEISNLVIHPNYRGGEINYNMFKMVALRVHELDIDFLLAKATIFKARHYRRVIEKLGMKMILLKNIIISKGEDSLERYLLVQDMSQFMHGNDTIEYNDSFCA